MPFIRVPNFPEPVRWMLQGVLDAISGVAQFVDEHSIHSSIGIVLLAVVVGMVYHDTREIIAVGIMLTAYALIIGFWMWIIHQNLEPRFLDMYEDSDTDDDQPDTDRDGQ